MKINEKISLVLFIWGLFCVIVGLFVKNGILYLFGAGLICIGDVSLFWRNINE